MPRPDPSDPAVLSTELKAEARRLGFDAVGIAPAVAPPGYPRYLDWLQRGHAAGMDYLAKRAEPRSHPGYVLEGVRSIVMVAISYQQEDRPSGDPRRGKVARYARGRDYHQVLWDRLGRLLAWLRARHPEVRGRAVADTAPLLEREYAQLSGLGWIGKNTMLINRAIGSYTLLGALLVDAELVPDEPHARSHCGTCTRCLEACPTGALAYPEGLDSRKCISYWTIEHRGHIPESMAEGLDGWVFGCDICQEVCPWNRKAPAGSTPELQPLAEWTDPDLIAWLAADDREFTRAIKTTAMSRAKRSGLLRNAALVLGQRRVRDAEAVLAARLRDPDPVVRAAAAWALGRIAGPIAVAALEAARDDGDAAVREAVQRALARIAGDLTTSDSPELSETWPASSSGSRPGRA